MRKPLLGAFLAVLLLALPAAAGAAKLTVDTSDYPLVRATFVGSESTPFSPVVKEDGKRLLDVVATNLGDAKSVLLAIDRSQSMQGQPIVDAIAAARSFVAAKPAEDRIAVGTFATESVLLTGFSTSTIDADGALRQIEIDPEVGTTLYDAVVLSATALGDEELPGRVLILMTDGNATKSSATLDDAIGAAQNVGMPVYVVAIESVRFTPAPLQRLAAETGGAYYGAASSAALTDLYASIAQELKYTWRLEYVTGALPGETVSVQAGSAGDSATAKLRAPGTSVITVRPEAPGRLPEQFFGSTWGQAAFAFVVGLLVLLAGAFLFAAPKGSWLRGRLAPHVVEKRRSPKQRSRERLAMASGLFKATENTLGNLKRWKRISAVLERADIPLRTVELVYIMLAGGLLGGLLAAALKPPVWFVAIHFVAGAFLPYGFVALKARRRLKAFENQLPDLLVTMAAGLKAGHSFRQALQSVVDEDQPPASKELKRVLTETRLGRPMDEALDDMARRIGSKNFEFVITAVTIQRQVGGSLAGLFDMVADTVRNRQQFAKKIKGLTAMGRASAYVLIALPFFVGAMLTILNAEYMRPLWHTGTGHRLIILTFVMMTVGSLILRKIVNFRY